VDGPIRSTQGTLLRHSRHSQCLRVCVKASFAQKSRDESVGRLVETMNDTFEFVNEAEPLKIIKSHKQIIVLIIQQAIECGFFIRDYSSNKEFSKFFRILKC
jgi:hypothetical protein